MSSPAFGDCVDQTACGIGALLDDVRGLAADRSIFVDLFRASFVSNVSTFRHNGGAVAWHACEGERLLPNGSAAFAPNLYAGIVPAPG